MAQDPQILWEDGALTMLNNRDRYTRAIAIDETKAAIRAEFNNRARTNSVLFDHFNHGYVTPVADGRYAVVWYDMPHGAQVKAIFPTHIDFSKSKTYEQLAELKKYLGRAIEHESKGKVSLMP